MGEMLIDLTVARNGLTDTSVRVPIPIVPAAVTDEDTAGLLNLPDQVESFHAI